MLHDDEIEITTSTPNGSAATRFSLRAISADYTVQGLHFTAGVVALFVLAVAGIALAIYLSRLGEPFVHFALHPLIFAGAMALTGVRMIPRFDRFEFSDHWRRPLFAIARERDQIEECDTFISDLLSRIERTTAPRDAATPEPTPEFDEVVDREPEWKWKVSVVAGAVTLAVTIAGGYSHDVASVAIFFLMGGPMCAAVASWLSFVEKEPHWRWGLLGLTLATIAAGLALQK